LHDLDRLGTGEWVGFSFPWMACLGARLGESKRADRAIRESLLHFTSRNGFNRNGDFLDSGASSAKSDIFTLEANFLIAAAIQECCLQSQGGIVRVFPALPESWGPTRFENWRTEGAHSVSASTCETSLNIDILCGCSGPLRLDVPGSCMGGSSARHRLNVEIQSGDALQFVIRANQKPVLTLNSKIINHD
jgi:alpha-L-fucosidase 2